MNSGRLTQGAVEHTAHARAAIVAYYRRLHSRKADSAKQAAIDRYKELTGRKVSEKTVRRWIIAVEACGGLKKLPKNAFWGKKSHPIPNPVLDRLSDIDEQVGKLFFQSTRHFPLSFAKRLLAIDQALKHCVSSVKEGSPRYFLRSIRQSVRVLSKHEPHHRRYRFISEAQLYAALTDVLVSLRKVAGKRTERAI